MFNWNQYKKDLIATSRDFCCPITGQILDYKKSEVVQVFTKRGWQHAIVSNKAIEEKPQLKAKIINNFDSIKFTFKLSEEELNHHRESYDGFCVYCNDITNLGGTEPDARGYTCESCNKKTILGIEEALMAGWIELK